MPTDPALAAANKSVTSAAASPFVVAIKNAGIKGLPSVINGAILLFVLSAANSDLYIGSRTLYALAAEGKAPRIFKRTNSKGVPYVSLALCSACCGLSYLSVSSGSKQVFTYFVALVTVFGALTWLGILYSHIRFMQALKAQGISRNDLPYKAPFQPYACFRRYNNCHFVQRVRRRHPQVQSQNVYYIVFWYSRLFPDLARIQTLLQNLGGPSHRGQFVYW